VNAIPAGWRWVTLNDLQANEPRAITDGPFGSNLTSAHYTESGPRVVRLQNIGDGEFIDAEAHISLEHFDNLRAHEVLAGDLLIASLGDSPPRACLAPAWLGPAIVKADCIRVRLSPTAETRWVLYALQAPVTRRWAAANMHGVGRPRLGLKAIRSIPIPLPPYKEQRRILETLEDHLSRLDAAREGVHRSAARATSLVTSSAMAALDAAAGEPVPLAEIAKSVRNGIFVSRPGREPIGVPILRISSVRPLSLDVEDVRYSEKPQSELAETGALVASGDLLFTRYNGNVELVGACAVVPSLAGPLTYPDKLIRVIVDERRAVPSFVALACSYGQGRQQIRARVKTTAGQAGISGRDLRTVRLPLPDLSEQANIAARFAEALAATRRLQATAVVVDARERTLRRAILGAAFSGQLTGRQSVELIGELSSV
jgi:type I restriction enzyme S subunit